MVLGARQSAQVWGKHLCLFKQLVHQKFINLKMEVGIDKIKALKQEMMVLQ